MTGQRKSDAPWWKIALVVMSLLTGSGLSIGGLQLYSPTNAQVQTKTDLLASKFADYVKATNREGELKDKYIQLELTHIKEGIARLEKQIENIEKLIKNGTK